MTWRPLVAFCLASAASLAVTVGTFVGMSQPLRFGAVYVGLILVQVLVQRRLWLSRELAFYAAFAIYNAISIVWTSDFADAIPNLELTFNFGLLFVLCSSLVALHPRGAVLAGALTGSLLGALAYTRLTGFPFVYPEDFSYNSIASMYLLALFLTAAYGWRRGSRLVPIAIGLALMLLIAATTSIKSNLGVALGACASALAYFRAALRAVMRSAMVVLIFAAVMAYVIASDPALSERLTVGSSRVSTGANVLAARDAANGDAGLSMRQNWKNLGIKGWLHNPVVGNGVESFRGDFGVTSHSTPIDLLYNTGLIGCLLFYGMFASLGWRLLRPQSGGRSPRALVLATIVCTAFISLSGTLYYDAPLAVALSICCAMMARPDAERRKRRGSAVVVERDVSAAPSAGALPVATMHE